MEPMIGICEGEDEAVFEGEGGVAAEDTVVRWEG